MKEALLRMVRAARKSLSSDSALRSIGYNNTPYWEIYGDTADAIYLLIGEHTITFFQSVTYHVLTSDQYTEDQMVDMLMSEYERNKLLAE